MGADVNALAERITAMDWAGSFDNTRPRVLAMREYLRRAAWWARATGSQQWPFFDIAAAVDPAVRADPTVLDQVRTHLEGELQGVQVQRVAERALHFAALRESGAGLPDLPDPYEPLLRMFELGGGFRIEGGGLIEVDTAGLRPGTLAENLTSEPFDY